MHHRIIRSIFLAAAGVVGSIFLAGGTSRNLVAEEPKPLTAPAENLKPPTAPVEVRLPHQGDVFGEGGEWDKQFAREALQIFMDLKPDPTWVAKLKALPDNTWMKCNPPGGEPERGRSEVPLVYLPEQHAMMFCCGCTDPGYSSDTWLYYTGANRWVQMWPNFIKGGDQKLNKGPAPMDRPFHRCSFGMAWDLEHKRVILRGGANAGAGGGHNYGLPTWEYDPSSNRWKEAAGEDTGCGQAEENSLGYVPGLGVVEVYCGGSNDVRKKCKAAETWVWRPAAAKWEKLATQGAPPGSECSRLVWAAKGQRLMYWACWASQLWAFDPKTLTWEDVSPKEGPKPVGFWRQGMAYDSANDAVILFGSEWDDGKKSLGPWVYRFSMKTWTDMKPTTGPISEWAHQQMMIEYDPEYNVVVIAGNARGNWVYRYKSEIQGARE